MFEDRRWSGSSALIISSLLVGNTASLTNVWKDDSRRCLDVAKAKMHWAKAGSTACARLWAEGREDENEDDDDDEEEA